MWVQSTVLREKVKGHGSVTELISYYSIYIRLSEETSMGGVRSSGMLIQLALNSNLIEKS